MFGMFINTLNEKRTVLSFLHDFAAAVGQRVQKLWDPPPFTPRDPATLPSHGSRWQHSTMALKGSQENDLFLQGRLLNSSPSAKTAKRQRARKR